MTFRDDLISVLELGWNAARRAWRLMASNQDAPFSPDTVGETGRELDQLAYDLRRLGFGKPARMAFSVAFIVNGLASQSIQFDRDLADKTSQIIAILAEMLLELESTSEISIDEPVEIVEHLRIRCGLVIYADDHQASRPPRPHFRRPEPAKPLVDEAQAALIAVSEELVWASESLLNRVMREGDFPHVTSLSRIHHLGKTLRDQIASSQASDLETKLSLLEPALVEVADVVDKTPLTTARADTKRRRFAHRTPRVLIVDESPFFRMLLSTAINGIGYVTQVAASSTEALGADNSEEWDLIICGEELVERNESFGQWLRDRINDGDSQVITLVNQQTEPSGATDHHSQIRRTDIARLMSLIKSQLGPATDSVRQSA